jgi:hypothetical protein
MHVNDLVSISFGNPTAMGDMSVCLCLRIRVRLSVAPVQHIIVVFYTYRILTHELGYMYIYSREPCTNHKTHVSYT